MLDRCRGQKQGTCPPPKRARDSLCGRGTGHDHMRSRGALIALALGWALILQSIGWAQTSCYAFVKALGHGTTTIDAYHWETRDKSYINGHFYSVKAPGLAFALTPPLLALDVLGAPALARTAADHARDGGAHQWTY